MTDTTVANEIARQMGGAARMRLMLGATQIVALENGLRVKFPNRNRSRGNCVEVKLMPSDTYKVTFYNVSSKGAKVVRECDDIYCDQLIELFEEQTGYYLRF